MKALISAGMVGALVALVIVGGFLALDKTTLHWFAESNNGSSSHSSAIPVFADTEVETLTENAIEDASFKLPPNTHYAKCVKAEFRAGNDKWIVTCEFRANPGDQPLQTRLFVFDDAAGQVKASAN